MAEGQGYIGRSPGDSAVIIASQTFEPTGIQTNFTFASGYDPGYIDVYLNGARLIYANDYTATDGSTVALVDAAANGDVLECVAYKAFNVAQVSSSSGNFTVGQDLTVTGFTTGGSAYYSGIVTATSFSGDGSALTGVASTDNIITGTAATFTNQVAIDNLSVTGVTTTGIGTISTSVVVGSAVTVTATAITIDPAVTTTIDGDVNFQGGNYNISRSRANSSIDFDDNAKARFGTGNDLEIYANGSTSIIDSTNQNIDIQSSGVINIKPGDASGIIAWNGAAVDIYYNASKKLETLAIGAKVTGELQVTSGIQATGVCTATSFVGSGALLTDLPASGDANDITACLFI